VRATTIVGALAGVRLVIFGANVIAALVVSRSSQGGVSRNVHAARPYRPDNRIVPLLAAVHESAAGPSATLEANAPRSAVGCRADVAEMRCLEPRSGAVKHKRWFTF
jgi:hypothetical protein